MNKRGFELAINILVIIILALLVLLTLTLAFSYGFENFWGKVKGYFGSDIDTLKNQCENQCDLGNVNSYCCEIKKLDKEEITCLDSRLKVDCDINCENVC